MRITDALSQAVAPGLTPRAATWMKDALGRVAQAAQPQLLELYTAAARHLGDQTLPAGATLGPEWSDLQLERWTVEDAGRALLLLTRADAGGDADRFAADCTACLEQGDAAEQRSWLRAVALLPDAGRYAPLVIDACRTNILPVFEAVACENPYPARFFPERNFNQLVLKALFNGISLSRITGLDRRANPELARMAADYAAERRAAGRTVPADIHLALAGAPETTQS